MALMSAAAATTSSPDLSGRDLTLDLARIACVVLVIVIHLLQVGIGRAPDLQGPTKLKLEKRPAPGAEPFTGPCVARA